MNDTNAIRALLASRPLPTLSQWLEAQGDGTRGEGHDFMEAVSDLLRRMGEKEDLGAMTPDELSFARMFVGFGIAVVELCNIEWQKGRSPEQIIQTMPRALGAQAMYSTASVLEGDTPWRVVARVLIEEFRHGAKQAADQLSAESSS